MSASEQLRALGVEIDLSDHRPPEEILHALGFIATVSTNQQLPDANTGVK